MRFFPAQQSHDQFYQYVFLIWGKLCHQQRQCRQPRVIYHRLPVGIQQPSVAVEEIHKQESTAALIAINERMILYHEIDTK